MSDLSTWERQPSKSRAAWVLRVLEGCHAGASREMSGDFPLLVGSADDCDIILSDPGVARHHVLISGSGERMVARALDATFHLGPQAVAPGDTVNLVSPSRLHMGAAAVAVGEAGAEEWRDVLTPITPPAPRRDTRFMPALVGLAVLSLISVALFAGAARESRKSPTPLAEVQTLISRFGVLDAHTGMQSGVLTLSGTVADSGTRERLARLAREQSLPLKLDLRTGDDIAADVREVLRSHGLAAKTEYVGRGDVRISGYFIDENKLRAAVTSRAMLDVEGVRRVIPRNLSESGAPAPDSPASPSIIRQVAPVFVSLVHGNEPHVLTDDGRKFRVGDALPDGRQLVAIGDRAWTINSAGVVEQVVVSPVKRSRGVDQPAS